jgi:hypothetical protein
MTGIYKITSPTGKIYIGQSVDISERWRNLKVSLSTKNRVKTKEHQDKITLAIRNRVLSEQSKANIRKVSCIEVINTETGEIFDSIRTAASSIGMKDYNLSNRLSGFIVNNTNFKYLKTNVQS